MNSHPLVSIIILNWDGKEMLKKCLGSLKQNTGYPNYNVIVVDNGSMDGSVEMIEKEFSWVDLIKLDKNYGFAKGNNIGIKEALKDTDVKYIALLNNDTKVKADWLKELVQDAGESDEKRGIYASKIVKMDNPEIIDSTGYVFRFGRIIDRGQGKVNRRQYDTKIEVIGACAAACLYKREMLEEIGLFEETYITYYEDMELSWRAYRNGWRARYVPTSIVYHKGGGTAQKTKEIADSMGILCLKNAVTTARRYANFKQKVFFSVQLIKMGICSGCGKLLGRNDIGVEPYIDGLKKIWIPKDNDQDE